MTYYGRDAAQHYQQRQRQAMEAIGWYEKLRARAQAAGRRCRDQLGGMAEVLAQAYLPGLTQQTIDRAEQLTGFVGFKRRDPLKAMAHEKLVLEKTLARILADPRYVQRDTLAGPDGTLGAKLDQAREMIEPFRAECAKFESLDGFVELVQINYDTPDFAESWWQGDYWKHWQQGDLICKALDMDDFGDDVLPAYQQAAKERDFWQHEITSLEAQLGEIHGLVRQHDEAAARIPQLAALYLEQCQDVLAKHLVEADVSLLGEWLGKEAADDRPVRMGLRRMSGLRAKFETLRELHDQGLEGVVKDLHARMQKYSQKATKFTRPRHWNRTVAENELDLKFEEKYRKLEANRAKLVALIDRIEGFDDYERFDLDNDADLWWHAFTHGKHPPRLLPRLRRYYDKNPNAAPIYDDSLSSAQAVAEAAREASRTRDDVGYLS